jgi:hypothetical protein
MGGNGLYFWEGSLSIGMMSFSDHLVKADGDDFLGRQKAETSHGDPVTHVHFDLDWRYFCV